MESIERSSKEAAKKNLKSIYVPKKTQDKAKNEQSNLMNVVQLDDKGGEENEFLFSEKTVILIHGQQLRLQKYNNKKKGRIYLEIT
ncbi:unnamed protein product [Paramecium sonneborni]|uniref:Uncharacterized protein n=1 Tax=Paramecium sonneborni TaxID=65129 RepID=A0A8S1NAP8_9CILI|nr:unnamed protein product [Paramecium sonneborni]